MNYDFDNIIDRRNSDSIKWHEYENDILPLWVADMDFLSPPEVISALHQRVDEGIFGYPQEPAILRELIVARLSEKYNWQVKPETIVFLPGVIVGFNLACHTTAKSKGSVLVQPPVYPPILEAAEQAGLTRQENILFRQTDGKYAIDFNAFENSISEQTTLFLLCNPHNPIGRVFRPDELSRLADICLRHNIPICSDEIHCDLVFDGHQHTPIATLDPEVAAKTITLMSPSKTFNIAGLECAYAIIPDPKLRLRYQKAKQGLVSGINLLGWIAATAAYQHGEGWLTELRQYIQNNRNFLIENIRRDMPDIQVAYPDGTYLAWLDCRNTEFSDKPGNYFLQEARVALNEGETFGTGGAGHVRLNFGCPRTTLIEALARMKDAYYQSKQ